MRLEVNQKVLITDANECYWDILCRKGGLKKIPNDSIKNINGVYIFWDWDDKPIRIGKAMKVRNRLHQYESDCKFQLWSNDIQFVSAIYTKSNIESAVLEDELIKYYQPKNNVHGK